MLTKYADFCLLVTFLFLKYKENKLCYKVILTKNITLQRIEQLSLIKCNYIRN
jgi:hypothetical protein